MLRLIAQEDEPLFYSLCQQDPVFGTILLTLYVSHRENWQQFTAWIGLDGHRKPRYALCRYGHRYTLCAPQGLTPFCQKELTGFLGMEPEPWLEGEASLLKKMVSQTGWSLEMRDVLFHPHPSEAPSSPGILACTAYSDMCRLICQAQHVDRQDWLSLMFPLFRDGMYHPFTMEESGKLIVCAITETAPGSSTALFSSLVTDREYRSRGYGKAMILHMCAFCAKLGRIPYLVCGEQSLTSYYTPLGFRPCSMQYGLLRGNPM